MRSVEHKVTTSTTNKLRMNTDKDKHSNAMSANSDKGNKIGKTMNTSRTMWRRTTSYILESIRKVIIVKTICEVKDNRPIGNESVIFTTIIDPSSAKQYTPDRVIHVAGAVGLLFLIDTNVYLEIKDGSIVNGDITRNQMDQRILNGK